MSHAPITVPSPPPPIAEDEWGWNCLVMGNRQCGTDTWFPLEQAEIEQLPPGQDPTGCLTDWLTIICPDGLTIPNEADITEPDPVEDDEDPLYREEV